MTDARTLGDCSSVSRALGEAARLRGLANEARALEVLQSTPLPPWAGAARRATDQEDRGGVDIVVDSDVGSLYVQVKSSAGAAKRFLKRRRRVAVVVVTGTMPESLIRGRLLAALTDLRSEYLSSRPTEEG